MRIRMSDARMSVYVNEKFGFCFVVDVVGAFEGERRGVLDMKRRV